MLCGVHDKIFFLKKVLKSQLTDFYTRPALETVFTCSSSSTCWTHSHAALSSLSEDTHNTLQHLCSVRTFLWTHYRVLRRPLQFLQCQEIRV